MALEGRKEIEVQVHYLKQKKRKVLGCILNSHNNKKIVCIQMDTKIFEFEQFTPHYDYRII